LTKDEESRPVKDRRAPATATFLIPSWSAAIDDIIEVKNVMKSVMEAISAVT